MFVCREGSSSLIEVTTDDSVAVTRTVSVAELVNGWPELIADMLCRVLRVFDARASVTGREIADWSKEWAKR